MIHAVTAAGIVLVQRRFLGIDAIFFFHRRDLGLRACQAHKARSERRHVAFQNLGRIAFRIDGDEDGHDAVLVYAHLVQRLAHDAQGGGADIGAEAVAEIDQLVFAVEIGARNPLAVLVGQGEGPAHLDLAAGDGLAQAGDIFAFVPEQPTGQRRHQQQVGNQGFLGFKHGAML